MTSMIMFMYVRNLLCKQPSSTFLPYVQFLVGRMPPRRQQKWVLPTPTVLRVHHTMMSGHWWSYGGPFSLIIGVAGNERLSRCCASIVGVYKHGLINWLV